MKSNKILHIVHCVDTEGPLTETIVATFERIKSIFGISFNPTIENLRKLQSKKIKLNGMEDAIANCLSPELIKYNTNWVEIEKMLDEILSNEFRNQYLDDFDNGWVFSWHCMDHLGYLDNPRSKDVGYGNIFRYYRNKINKCEIIKDEINWHFHPLSVTRNPLHAATSYTNSYDILNYILCRRVIDDEWFPVVNRPGFHAERPDSHSFLEQWIPFDYANQFCEEEEDQPDMKDNRFGDWTRAPKTWRGYHPSHDDYQVIGNCRRTIFRCLNFGTRLRTLNEKHIYEAFNEAKKEGSAILSFANHDYRDMRLDINNIRNMIHKVKESFPDVLIKYNGAEKAAISLIETDIKEKPKISIQIIENRVYVEVEQGDIFGPQPFLAIKTKEGKYYHDNFDTIIPKKKWSYIFDQQTIEMENIEKIGVGTAGKYGGYCVETLIINKNL